MSQSDKAAIPGEPKVSGRDPESKRIVQYQPVLDPPPLLARDDDLRYDLQ